MIENSTKSSLIIVPVPVPVLTTGPVVTSVRLTVKTSSASWMLSWKTLTINVLVDVVPSAGVNVNVGAEPGKAKSVPPTVNPVVRASDGVMSTLEASSPL